MTTHEDRELLELAARAAEIELATFDEQNVPSKGSHARIWPQHADDREPTVLFWSDSRSHPMCRKPNRPGNVEWNPLTDDGDALRLAVKLQIDVNHGDAIVVAERIGPQEAGVAEAYTDDPYAGTRRAIVRAAASIGEGMKK